MENHSLETEEGMHCSWCGSLFSRCECPAKLARSIDKERAEAIRERNELRAALLAARREVTVAPLPTEILAIRAARDFCADHAMSGMAVTLIDEYIARCRAALAATQEPR